MCEVREQVGPPKRTANLTHEAASDPFMICYLQKFETFVSLVQISVSHRLALSGHYKEQLQRRRILYLDLIFLFLGQSYCFFLHPILTACKNAKPRCHRCELRPISALALMSNQSLRHLQTDGGTMYSRRNAYSDVDRLLSRARHWEEALPVDERRPSGKLSCASHRIPLICRHRGVRIL